MTRLWFADDLGILMIDGKCQLNQCGYRQHSEYGIIGQYFFSPPKRRRHYVAIVVALATLEHQADEQVRGRILVVDRCIAKT